MLFAMGLSVSRDLGRWLSGRRPVGTGGGRGLVERVDPGWASAGRALGRGGGVVRAEGADGAASREVGRSRFDVQFKSNLSKTKGIPLAARRADPG